MIGPSWSSENGQHRNITLVTPGTDRVWWTPQDVVYYRLSVTRDTFCCLNCGEITNGKEWSDTCPTPCANCGFLKMLHVNGKCLFHATSYKPSRKSENTGK